MKLLKLLVLCIICAPILCNDIIFKKIKDIRQNVSVNKLPVPQGFDSGFYARLTGDELVTAFKRGKGDGYEATLTFMRLKPGQPRQKENIINSQEVYTALSKRYNQLQELSKEGLVD